LPAMDPFGNALLHIDGIRIYPNPARPLERLKRTNHGHKLHAVVCGQQLAAEYLLFMPVIRQPCAPATRPRVSLAGAIGIDFNVVVLVAHCFFLWSCFCVGVGTRPGFSFDLCQLGRIRRMPMTRFLAAMKYIPPIMGHQRSPALSMN